MTNVSVTLTPLIHEQWWWLCVSWLDPRGKQTALVRLVPEILVQVCVRDLLQGLNVMHWYEMAVQVHELNSNLSTQNERVRERDTHREIICNVEMNS